MAYFSGQGRVYIGARDDLGNPAGLTQSLTYAFDAADRITAMRRT